MSKRKFMQYLDRNLNGVVVITAVLLFEKQRLFYIHMHI